MHSENTYVQNIAQGGNVVKQNIFRTKLFEARKTKKLSQLDVALELGIDRARISDWENGKEDLRIETVIKLARMYEDPEVYTLYMREEHGADDLVPSFPKIHNYDDLRLVALEIQNEFNDVVEEIPKLMKIFRDGKVDDNEQYQYQHSLEQIHELFGVVFPIIVREEMQKKKALQDRHLERAYA